MPGPNRGGCLEPTPDTMRKYFSRDKQSIFSLGAVGRHVLCHKFQLTYEYGGLFAHGKFLAPTRAYKPGNIA